MTLVRNPPSGNFVEVSGGSGVESFNGRDGVVVSENGDYDSSQIDDGSDVGGANVEESLNILNARPSLLAFFGIKGFTDAGDFLGPFSSIDQHSLEARCQWPCPLAANVVRITALNREIGGATVNWSATVRVNGVDTETISLNIGEQNTFIDVSITIEEGDLISVRCDVEFLDESMYSVALMV